jgi:hypothetical protein
MRPGKNDSLPSCLGAYRTRFARRPCGMLTYVYDVASASGAGFASWWSRSVCGEWGVRFVSESTLRPLAANLSH